MDAWLAVFENADDEQSCIGSVVAVERTLGVVVIATAAHCIDVIASVRIGRRRHRIAATSSQFAIRTDTDFMLALLIVDPNELPRDLAPIELGGGEPDNVRVRRKGRVSALSVRDASPAEARLFDQGVDEATRNLCGLRLTLTDAKAWRIQDRDSGGPVLAGGKLVGVLSSETLTGTRTSSYCPAALPPCEPDDLDCWRRAGFHIVPSFFTALRLRRERANVAKGASLASTSRGARPPDPPSPLVAQVQPSKPRRRSP